MKIHLNLFHSDKSDKDIVPLWIRFLLVFPVVFLLGVRYDTPIYCVIALVLILLPGFLKKPLTLSSQRTTLYGCLGILLCAVIPYMVLEIDPDRQSFLDSVVRLSLFGPLLAYASAFALCFKRNTIHQT